MPTEDSSPVDPLAEHRQRARWRLIGALIFATAASALSYGVLLDTPRPLARDFTVLMPKGGPSSEAPAPSPPASEQEAPAGGQAAVPADGQAAVPADGQAAVPSPGAAR